MATEKRLIDLDKIKPMDFPSTEMDGLDVVRYLSTLPTVDAVEVVLCKDCKRCDGFPGPDVDENEIGICKINMLQLNRTDSVLTE